MWHIGSCKQQQLSAVVFHIKQIAESTQQRPEFSIPKCLGHSDIRILTSFSNSDMVYTNEFV